MRSGRRRESLTPAPRHVASDRTSTREPDRQSHRSAVQRRYAQLRARIETSAAGHVHRRLRELDIMNHALIMASLSLTLLIPALVTVAALVPLGRHAGVGADLAHRLGLSAAATRDLQSLFPTPSTVVGTTTGISAMATILFAIGWPAELQRGYQSVWSLPSRGLRDIWRSLVWLISLFALVGTELAAAAVFAGAPGVALTAGLGVPAVFVWTWWTQHLLLGGRVSWRALLPGAIATSAALLGFRLAMHIYLPVSIVANSDRYGPLGVVFALLSWIIGFSAVMLGGPLVGHTIYVRRRGEQSGRPQDLSRGFRARGPAE